MRVINKQVIMTIESDKRYVKTIGQGKGDREWLLVAVLSRVVKVGFTEKMTYEQMPERKVEFTPEGKHFKQREQFH